MSPSPSAIDKSVTALNPSVSMQQVDDCSRSSWDSRGACPAINLDGFVAMLVMDSQMSAMNQEK